MRVAIYARVSTHNGQQDPELQLRELREYCGRHGWDLTGVCGSHQRRQGEKASIRPLDGRGSPEAIRCCSSLEVRLLRSVSVAFAASA
jgi:hypothetical protein